MEGSWLVGFLYSCMTFIGGLVGGIIYNETLIHLLKESSKKFLDINIGIDWPSKVPLFGPKDKAFTSNIKVIEPPVKKILIP